ncbi:TolC family protein [Desulforamulus ruminis]|uniref:TolC family protein n=1 Tax=Desulforamulus ruminis TaxID=1564 RepID=UPI002FD8D7BE
MHKMTKSLLLLVLSLSLVFPGISLAAEQPDTLSLERAIDRALTFSSQIKIDQTEIDKQEYLVKRSQNAVTYTPTDINFNPNEQSALSSHMQNQFNLRKSEKKLEADKRQVVLDAKTAYYGVLKAQKSLEVSRLSYQVAQLTLLQAESKYKVGLINNADLLVAQSKVAADKAGMVKSQNELDDAYATLNKLINVDITARPQLIDQIEIEKVDFDPYSKANIAAENSYDTWTAEEAARVADRVKIFATYYDVADDEVAQAQETAKDARELIRKQTRALVNGLNTLNSNYEELLKKQSELQEKLKVARAQESVGMATRDVVQSVELAVAQTEAALIEAASQYNITADTVRKLTGELAVKSNIIKTTPTYK